MTVFGNILNCKSTVQMFSIILLVDDSDSGPCFTPFSCVCAVCAAGSCHSWGYEGSFPGTCLVSVIPSPLWIGPIAQQIALCWENAVARGQMLVPRGLVL